jgi:hypothetical protein
LATFPGLRPGNLTMKYASVITKWAAKCFYLWFKRGYWQRESAP